MTRYCPAGDGEFEDWVARCPECGRTTTDHPPKPAPRGGAGEPRLDDPVVLLTTVANEPLAHLSAQVLAAEGIRSMTKPKGPGFGGWGAVTTFEHDVFVLRSERERAAAILAELDAGADENGDSLAGDWETPRP